jgi:selenocysteine lyase/cysteine desulfurase
MFFRLIPKTNKPMIATTPMKNNITQVFEMLEQSVYASLETYSNVHRGSGHYAMVSTRLFEQAREIVLGHLGLNRRRYTVIYCTPRRATLLSAMLTSKNYQMLSSRNLGLPLGIRALAVEKKALPGGIPFQTGGGNARLVSPGSVIWAGVPGRFEAGTPPIINIIAFARALQLLRQHGIESFHDPAAEKIAPAEMLYQDDLKDLSGQQLLDELKQSLIGRSAPVPTLEGERPYINLDNAASTPTFKTVWDTVRHTWRQSDQVHQEIIQEVSAITARLLGAPLASYDMIFTSNTTEAMNLVAENLSGKSEPGVAPVVLNTLLEHNSNDLPWRMIPNGTLVRLEVDGEGFVDLNELDSTLGAYNHEGRYGSKRIRLVAISGASNVLGTINDLAGISTIVHRHGAQLLVDAAQLVAHRKVEMEQWGIDYLTFSAHKVYAPFGTGVLAVRKGLLGFSSAERGVIRSSGEENVGGIAALGKALVLLQRTGYDVIREDEQALTARALRGLAQIGGLRIYGIMDPDSPGFAHRGGVIVFGFKNIMANRVAKELAERSGIGVRYGCHCAHILIKHILGVGPALARFQELIVTMFPKLSLPGLVRLSVGIGNSIEEIDTIVQTLDQISRKHRTKGNSQITSAQSAIPLLSQREIKKQINDFVVAVQQRVFTRAMPTEQADH